MASSAMAAKSMKRQNSKDLGGFEMMLQANKEKKFRLKNKQMAERAN